MHRSYLEVKENDFQIYSNKGLYNAEAIIIDVYDASCVFANFTKFEDMFKQLAQKKIDIYLKLDIQNLHKCYKALDRTIGTYISGFYINNPTPNILRRVSLKSREYELKQKLVFKSLKFIAVVNNIDHINNLHKIFRSSRVEYIIVKDVMNGDNVYIKDKTLALAKIYKKTVIDPKSITTDINKINLINEESWITKEVVNEALVFINKFETASKSDRKVMLQEDSLTRNYQILDLAKRLNWIDDCPRIYFVRHNKQEKVVAKEVSIKKFYTLGEEIANSVTHGVGIALAIVATILLIIKGGTKLEVTSYLVFTMSALLLYMMSTLYHAFSLGKKTKSIFQKFDHMTIYLLIAGSYTPFSLIAIGGETGIGICIFLWVGCLSGLLLNLFAFGRFRFLHMFLYVALGWVAILFMPQITLSMETNGVMLLILGGLMYTIGIIFYALKLFKFTHMVWHIFTLLGTIAHFLAILLYL
jgi:hemolysin III